MAETRNVTLIMPEPLLSYTEEPMKAQKKFQTNPFPILPTPFIVRA